MARKKLKHSSDSTGLWDGLKLSAMEKAFIIEWSKPEYFLAKNKTDGKYNAFEAAGYKVRFKQSMKTGKMCYHPSTKAMMSEITGKPDFKEGLRRWRDHILGEDKEIIKGNVVDVLFKRATYPIDLFIDNTGRPKFKTWEEIPEEWRCVVDGIETRAYGKDAKEITSMSLARKTDALKLLAQFTSLTKESDLQVAARVTAGNNKKDIDDSPVVEFVFNKKYTE